MSESVGRFRVQSVLRNIVRAARDEPLGFAGLSQIEGHNTSTNTFPTIPPISWVTGLPGTGGAGSSAYNVSSDFTLNPVDDSASIAALLNPLDASTIALFSQRSGYATDFLYLLLIDKFRIAGTDGRVLAEFNRLSIVEESEDQQMCMGDPDEGFCGPRTMLGYTLLAYLKLRFNLDKVAVHGLTARPRAQVCFGRGTVPGKWSDFGLKPTGERIAIPPRAKPAVTNAAAHPSYCDDERTWLPASPTQVEDSRSSQKLATERTQRRETHVGTSYAIYDDRNKVWIELTASSVWGIYQFLGIVANSHLERNKPAVRLIVPNYDGDQKELTVVNIVKGSRDDCFAETAMDDRSVYCVPNGPSSRLTRIYFNFLQQLTAMQRSAVSTEPRPSRNFRGVQ